MVTRDQVIDVLKTCFDPEIPVNIWDLGLIYDITIVSGAVNIKMTLTAVGCSLGPQLVSEIEAKISCTDGGQRLLDIHSAADDRDVVDQPQIPDVHRDLWIEAGLQHVNNLISGDHRAHLLIMPSGDIVP